MGKTISGVFTVRWGAEKGDKGDGGLSVQLSPSLMSFPADTAGIPATTTNFSVKAEIYSGGERQTITDSSLAYSDSNGYEVSVGKTTTAITISGRIKNKAFTNANPWIDITLICSKGTATARFNIILQRQGADGTSVMAQYSSDGSTWHSNYISGDVWMRTSTDCGRTWSAAVRIVGEKGDDGKTMYLHIAYANSATGADFTTDDDMSTERSYIGTYADFVQKDSERWQDYHWMRNKGDKGDKGDDALYIVCDGEGETYPADADGYATKNSTHTVTAELYYGTKALTDYTVEVSSADDKNWYTVDDYKTMAGDVYISSITRSGTKCIIVFEVDESNYTDNNAYIRFRLSCSYGVREKQINCYANKQGEKGEPGDNGTNGLTVRRSEWEAGKEYRNDTDRENAAADGNYYLDEVCVSSYNGGNGKYYICKETHKSTASNKPKENASTDEWTPLTSTAPIKTPFADITTAFIEFLQSRQINIVDSNNVPYGAFGGGDYPLWFGGKNADKAVFKVSKDGRAQMATYGYSISNAPAIDDYPTCMGIPVWLWAHDSENGQLAAAQYLTMESSIYVLSPGIDFSNKGDGYTPDNLIWCIPLAKDIGKFSLELYIKLPNAFSSAGSPPKLFICQGTLTGTPTGTLDGVYISKNYDCGIEVQSSSNGSSLAAYRIYDDALTENMIWKKYFSSAPSLQLGLEYGYMELKLWEDTSTVNRFKYLPRYVRLLSDGKNWHLVDYRY